MAYEDPFDGLRVNGTGPENLLSKKFSFLFLFAIVRFN